VGSGAYYGEILGDGANAMTDWVRVSERLPKPGEPVLTFRGGMYGGYGIGETYRWYLDGKWAATWRGNPVPSPAYWMPLPPKPKEEK
jgi:hypothetical protein